MGCHEHAKEKVSAKCVEVTSILRRLASPNPSENDE